MSSFPPYVLHKRLRSFYHCLAFISSRGQTPPEACPCLTAPLAGDTLMTSPAGGRTYAPHREKAAQLQRHKAHCHRRDDRRPHRVGGVSGVSEGISPPAHAYHRAHHLPDHVLLHRRGVSLHAEHPQVYRASLCFRADLAFLLHIFLARFHRLALLYPVLLRRRAQPDERYVVACVGSCDAARRGKQKDHIRAQCGCCSFCLSAL